MGYCISQVDSCFTIKKEKQEEAFKAVKEQMSQKSYHWVSSGWMTGLRDIYAVLECWNYEPGIDDNTGDIIEINFSAEKIGDEIELFKVIAPFVEKGSYIEMSGEDGCMWRWTFNGTTCKEIYAKVTWEDS